MHLKNVKVIPGEPQHGLLVADGERKKVCPTKKVVEVER